jgi:anti-anti-sigma factor
MRIVEESCGDVRILRLSGEFDATDVPEVAGRLDPRAGPARLVVNMRDVRFATAAVLGSLVVARARLRRRAGDLVVSAPSEAVVRLIRTLRLDRVLPRHGDDAAAVRHLSANGAAARVPLAAAS